MKSGPFTSLRCRCSGRGRGRHRRRSSFRSMLAASDGVSGGVLALEFQAQPGREQVGPQRARRSGVERAVEEHVLDPVVVVEVFQVAEVRQGAGRVGVQRRGAVGRKRQASAPRRGRRRAGTR